MTEPIKIWIIIFFLGIGTYLIRFSFLGLVGDRQLPKWFIQHLNFVGVAVMPGLIIPFLVWPDATGGTLDAPRLLAAIAALALMSALIIVPSVISADVMFCGAGWLPI